MFDSKRDSLIHPNVTYLSQVPSHGYGQEVFRKKVSSPGPALNVQFQPVETRAHYRSSKP
jgi:hypothetical protein